MRLLLLLYIAIFTAATAEEASPSCPPLDKSIRGELKSMLKASSLIYRFATLRKIVNEHELTFNQDKEDKSTLFAFKNPELIVTQNEDVERPYETTLLKYPITPQMILKFLVENRDHFYVEENTLTFDKEGKSHDKTMSSEDDDDDDGDDTLPMEEKLKALASKFDAEIIEFDDEFANRGTFGSELVYSIVLNRTEKRITVVFRGSVTTSDWVRNVRAFSRAPDEITEFAGNKPRVHGGFASYLFGQTHEKMNKFHQILAILKQLYAKEEYSDYELYVTGHSLGGALSQLLAFTLAGSSETKFIPKPVVAITYASPEPGRGSFNKAFQVLEKNGSLRHIRVSNQGDMVPVLPGILGFTQTGVNIHVYGGEKKKAQVAYRNTKWTTSQINTNAIKMHGLPVYRERLFVEKNNFVLDMTVQEIYDNYAGDFTK